MCGSGSVFRIRIQEAPEYGSNTDPDTQHSSKARMKNVPNFFPKIVNYGILVKTVKTAMFQCEKKVDLKEARLRVALALQL